MPPYFKWRVTCNYNESPLKGGNLKGVIAKNERGYRLTAPKKILLTDATDRSKIRSDQKHLFFAVSLYLL